MSFNAFSSSITQKFQELSTKTQEMTSNIPNVAQNTQRRVQEKLGNVTDISQLPDEYLKLESKIDTMKDVYEHFLRVTTIFEKESYDYPKEFSDSITDFTDSVGNKVHALTKSVSNSTGSSFLGGYSDAAKTPRTLSNALSSVGLTSSEKFKNLNDPTELTMVDLLIKFSDTEANISEARLVQDYMIQTKFNYHLKEELKHNIERAYMYRKEVHQKRLHYDIARSNLENGKPEKKANLRVQMEILEDEFTQTTKDATIVMQEIIANSKFEQKLKEMVVTQLAYHEKSTALLKNLLDTAKNPVAINGDDSALEGSIASVQNEEK